MKILFFLSLFLGSISISAQNFVEILKVTYGETFTKEFQNTENKTTVGMSSAELTIPVPLTEAHAIISGLDYAQNSLQLFPKTAARNLNTSTLKLGLASQWNEKWSSSIILLPKIASDYRRISNQNFYLGIFASFKTQQRENFAYRFGFYGSQEAYGVFATPTFGWYYLSSNNRFEMNTNLPISADLNYRTGLMTFGLDYVGISRSFQLYEKDSKEKLLQYVDLSSLDFSTYIQTTILHENILLRAKLGYSTNDYKVYASDEKLDIKLSAFKFGDHRNQLNPNISESLFLMLEMVYRVEKRKITCELGMMQNKIRSLKSRNDTKKINNL